MENRMNIMVFGQLAELTGSPVVTINRVDDTELLQTAIFSLYPALKQKTFLIAVDKQIVREKAAIGEHAEVALLPPFSGG